MDLGDYALESTFDFHFTTRRFSTGAPFTLAGTPVLSAYEDNSLTQITAGITLAADFDSVTGLNHVRIAATAANGYGSGQTYSIVITTGTVDSVSVVGEVVARFTIEDRSALRPTIAGRTLDVTATGAAGIDWANVENPTTAVDLSGTDIQLCDTVTTNTDMRGTDSALLASSNGSGLTEAGGTGDHLTAINLPNQTMDITGNITGNLSGSVGSVTGAVGSVTGAVGSVTGAVGSVAGNVDGNVTGSIGSLGATAKTDVNAEVDTAFTTAMADSVATDGSIATREQALYQILQFLTDRSVSGTTVTVRKVDGATSLFTCTLDDGTTPTDITRS